jgi:predicted lipid-binding transport protein (Tim44 family)
MREMTGSGLLEIVFLAAIAAFIAFRLYSVLGRRTGNEQPPFDPLNRRERVENRRTATSPKDDNVVPLPRPREPGRTAAAEGIEARIAPGSALALGIAQIRETDRSFSPDAFLEGAKVAHEMIARAYAEGDRPTLKPLLADEVYASFDEGIASREKAGHKVEFSFVGLKQANLEEAGLRGRIAEVTVKFVSELISATRDAAGAVIEGAAGVVREVTDVWTFARDTRSSDPNWKLVATAGAT